MRKTIFTSLLLAGVACLSLGMNARAQVDPTNNNEQPGSLLVFPLFDNTRGALTLVTVTNTSPTANIFAHFVYINAANCFEFDRPHYLSANDTITVRTGGGPGADNPNMNKGYIFVFAKKANSPTSEGPQAVKFDHLIGQEFIADSTGPDKFELNSFTFKAGDQVINELDNTDVNPANGKRDLNGHEYKTVPELLDFPRFFGQGPTAAPGSNGTSSNLVLLNLTGGGQFTAQVDFLIYDNNENQYSASLTFTCWIRLPLTGSDGVSDAFLNSFLISGASTQETVNTLGRVCGWFQADGVSANSTQTQLNNPAILGVLLDSLGTESSSRVGALPFGEGSNPNGRLLSHSLFGD